MSTSSLTLQGDSKLDELKGSLYMRLFGNEMSFQRFQGLQSFTSATSFNLLDFLIKLSKNHEVSMTHSMVSGFVRDSQSGEWLCP